MQSVPAPNQVEIGLSSMVSLLSKISEDNKESIDILNLISWKINSIYDSVEVPLMKVLMYSSKKYESIKDLIFQTKLTNFQLQDIYESINKLSLNNNPLIERPTNIIVQPPQINNVSTSKDNDFLKNISEKSTKILDFLIKKPKNNTESKNTESKEDVEKGGKAISSVFKTITDLATSLISIKKNLTDKLIQKLNKFGEAYLKLIDVPESKSHAFETNITNFSDIISKLGKTLWKPALALSGLTLAFSLLTFLVINPVFLLAIGAIGLMLNMITKFSDDKSIKNNNIDKLGYSILALTVAMIAMQFVSWESGVKMLLFIGGLNLALRGFSMLGGNSTKTDSIKNNPMIMFALGIGIFTITMLAIKFVDWESVAKMIVFIGGLGLALNFIGSGNATNNKMIQFATGIGILTLAMIVMTIVKWPSIFKMIVFVMGLGLTMSLFNFDEKGPKNSMVMFALGIGLMTLGILAIGEIDNEILIKGILFIAGLGLVMKLFNFDKMGPKNAMISFAFGFGIMVLAMYAINELPWEALGKTLLFLGGLGLILKLFKGTETLNMIGIGAGILFISGALYVFKKINWTLGDAISFGLTLVGLGAIFAAAGVPAVAALIGVGVLSMIGMSVGSILIALSIWAISNMSFNYKNIGNFILSAGILAIGFAALAIPAIPGAIGSSLFIPIVTAGLLGALSLWAISNMSFNNQSINNFILGVGSLIWGFAKMILTVPFAAGVAIALLPIFTSAYLGAKVLSKLNGLIINNDKIIAFGNGAKTLVNSINNIGGWNLVKIAAKAVLLLPIFSAGWLASKVLSSISNTEFNVEKINSLGGVIDSFTTMMSDTLSKNEDKLKSSENGIKALAKLMSVGGGIANVIQMMANMKFYEYTVKDGKLVLSGVRTLNSDDFKKVGENLGSMLQCLIEPLVILGSNSASFVIGGKVITNPFKSSTALKGIEMLSQLGNAFKPLAESVKTYSSIPMVSNPALLSNFSMSLMVMTNTFMFVFKKLSTLDNDLIDDSISNLVHFFDSLKNAETKTLTNLNDIFTKFTNNLSDQVKWKRIQNNLKIIKDQFGGIAKNINSIDIEKATAFERNIKNLIEKNNGENLKQAVESLTELLGMVKDNQGTFNNVSTSSNSNTIPGNPFTNAVNNTFGTNINQKGKENTKKPSTQLNKNNSDFEATVISLLQQVVDACGIDFPKKMNVVIVDDLTRK